MPNSDEILAANTKLREEIKSFRDSVANFEAGLADVDNREKHTRWGLYGVAFVIIVALLIGGWAKLDDVSDKAGDNQDEIFTLTQVVDLIKKYQAEACLAGNDSRKLEKSLWDTIFSEDKALAEEEGTPYTEREQKSLDKIDRKVRKAYPQRDCTKVNEGKVVDTDAPSANP